MWMKELLDLRVISFNANGGSPVPSNQHLLRGDRITAPGSPERAGHTFTGWYTDNSTFLTPWDFDDYPAGDMTLYASWEIIPVIPVNGITVITQPTKLNYVHGESLDLAGLEVRLGYEDGSFSGNIPFANFANYGITASPANGTVLYINTHNDTPITVSIESFSDTTNPITVTKAPGANVSAFTVSGNVSNSTITVSGVTFTTGQTAEYSFSTTDAPGTSWQTNATSDPVTVGITYYVFVRSAGNDNYEAGTPNTPGRQIAFYTVTFDTNGGGTNPPAVTAVIGTMISAPTTNPTRSGYNFGGWYDIPADTGGNQWNFAASTVTTTTTLFARWLSNSSTITLDVAAITEGAPLPVDNITISRSGTGGHPQQLPITVAEPGLYTSIRWEVDGVGAYTGQTVGGTGPTFTLDANINNLEHVKYNTFGGHTLRLYVVIGGVEYMRNINFTIVE